MHFTVFCTQYDHLTAMDSNPPRLPLWTCPKNWMLSPKLQDDIQWLFASTVLSTILYGTNFILAVICLSTLLKRRKEDGSKTWLMALCVFTAGMLSLATASIGRSNWAIIESSKVMIIVLVGQTRCVNVYERLSTVAFYGFGTQLYDVITSPCHPIAVWCSHGVLVRVLI